MWYASANRDEAVFDHADSFDVTRESNPHFAFGGGGPHYCVGASLARLELGIMLEESSTRMPDLRVVGPMREGPEATSCSASPNCRSPSLRGRMRRDSQRHGSRPCLRHVYDLGSFTFFDGTVLPGAFLAYSTYGTMNADHDNVITPTWFTGTPETFEWLIGPGKPLDTDRYFVVAPSMFGNGHSSSPSNTPAPYDRARFPRHTIADNVRAQHQLMVGRLGITGVEMVFGGSTGTMQAYEAAIPRPELAPAGVRRMRKQQGNPALFCLPQQRGGRPARRPVLRGWRLRRAAARGPARGGTCVVGLVALSAFLLGSRLSNARLQDQPSSSSAISGSHGTTDLMLTTSSISCGPGGTRTSQITTYTRAIWKALSPTFPR